MGFTTMVVNKGLEKARAYLNHAGPLGLMALHPLGRIQYKLLLKTPSEYTFSLFRQSCMTR